MKLSPWSGDDSPTAWNLRRVLDGSTLGALVVLRVYPARGGYAWDMCERHGIEVGRGWRETRQAARDDADARAVAKGHALSAGEVEPRA